MSTQFQLIFILLSSGFVLNVNALFLDKRSDFVPSIIESINDDVNKIVTNVITSGDLFSAEYLPLLKKILETDLLNTICIAGLQVSKMQPQIKPSVDEIKFQFRAGCKRYDYDVLHVAELATNPDFDPNKKVVIFSAGWMTPLDSIVHREMAKAINCRGDSNYIALDTGGFLQTVYADAVLNIKDIGEYVAKGLAELQKIVPLENIHVIGHSLGAQIVGLAARNFTQLTGKMLPRITGLDPANPCFEGRLAIVGLQQGDADFVDVIHSNPHVMGKRDPIGDIDFYINGLNPLVPGCSDALCAHLKALSYYVESVYPGNEENFIGRRCTSMMALRYGRCTGESVVMGYSVPTDKYGIYSLKVNAFPPYGENGDPQNIERNEQCGLCET